MLFTSVTFLIFFPIVILAYFLIPKRFRYVWLLFCSYFFYFCQDNALPVYLLFTTLITYAFPIIIDKQKSSSARKVLLVAGIVILLSGLACFKYLPSIFDYVGQGNAVSLFMPLGISFFTFQSLSYIIDCYRGKLSPERNFIKVALYVSFFVTILSGPIQRGEKFIPQLSCDYDFDTVRAKDGLFFMLWGFFLKIVIAGRLSILTDQVIGGYNNYSGSVLLFALIMYAFLIYCDFAGYSFIAIGAGRILGFDLGINFRQPYLCVSIGDFWRRWHISLSTWFRDYLYIPLGGSRRGTLRKYINVMIVFALSGLWHGNTANFLIWGILNGFYQVMGQVLTPLKSFLKKLLHLEGHTPLIRVLSIAGSFILLTFGWLFFRVSSFSDALNILGRIFGDFGAASLFDGTVFTLGLGTFNLIVALSAVAVLIVCDILCEKHNCDVAGLLPKIGMGWRWLVYYGLLAAVIMSMNLSTTEFIYSKF